MEATAEVFASVHPVGFRSSSAALRAEGQKVKIEGGLQGVKLGVEDGPWEFVIDRRHKGGALSGHVQCKGEHLTVRQRLDAGKLGKIPTPTLIYQHALGDHVDVELEQCFYSKRSVASVTLKGSGAKATATARRVGGVEGVQGTVKGELSIPGASTLVGAAVCTQEGCTLRLENTSLRNLKLKLSHKVMRGQPVLVDAEYRLPGKVETGTGEQRVGVGLTAVASAAASGQGVSKPMLGLKIHASFK